MPRVVVVGGGAAGMMAAGRAAQCSADVVLLEKGPRLGRKLRIAGKGRGNVTNTAELQEFIEAFTPNGKFLYSAFSRFFNYDLIAFLQEWGVPTKEERGGRVFPVSDIASDIVDAFDRYMQSVGVRVRTGTAVKSIVVEDGRVVGVEVFGGTMKADAVIITTGGASYPTTGSTGDGYAMAREHGHTITPIRPALSALYTEENWVKRLQGLSLKNVEATLYAQAQGTEKPRKISAEFGEMLFTHFGISGPIILTLSRKAGELLKQGKVIVSIDLKPALTQEQLHERLIRDFKQTRHFKNYLPELLPRLLVDVFVDLSGVDPDKAVNSITSQERNRIVELLKNIQVTITKLAPLDQAIVTGGGVSIKEIDPGTMMSKLVQGLFFAGEVIDIDAETGGFNLQAAFSTGYVAGESAAQYGSEVEDA